MAHSKRQLERIISINYYISIVFGFSHCSLYVMENGQFLLLQTKTVSRQMAQDQNQSLPNSTALSPILVGLPALTRDKKSIFNCNKCNLKFSSKRKYDKHYYRFHKSDQYKPSKCYRCNPSQTFSSSKEYKNHWDKTHRETSRLKSLQKDKNDVSQSKPSRCFLCTPPRVFDTIKGYRKHYNLMHKSKRKEIAIIQPVQHSSTHEISSEIIPIPDDIAKLITLD